MGKYVSLGVARDEVSPCPSEDRWVKVRMIAVGQIVSFRTAPMSSRAMASHLHSINFQLASAYG